jgi:hypothetical protein
MPLRQIAGTVAGRDSEGNARNQPWAQIDCPANRNRKVPLDGYQNEYSKPNVTP